MAPLAQCQNLKQKMICVLIVFENPLLHVFPNWKRNHTIGVLSSKFTLQFTMSLTFVLAKLW